MIKDKEYLDKFIIANSVQKLADLIGITKNRFKNLMQHGHIERLENTASKCFPRYEVSNRWIEKTKKKDLELKNRKRIIVSRSKDSYISNEEKSNECGAGFSAAMERRMSK